jgi:hypothetical protein
MNSIKTYFRFHKLLSVYIGLGAIWIINASTIFRSSWAGDDWPISQTPYWIQWRYGALTNWNIWTEAMFWNDQWMKGAGRFYPLTWVESRFVFSYFRELWQYKTYQVAMLIIAGLLLVLVCYLFSRSHSFTILVLASLSLTVQFRRDFDPHLAFSVMLPSLLIKIFLAVILAYFAGAKRKKATGAFLGFLAGVIFFAAMSTYEFGFLLFPLLVFSFLIAEISNESNTAKSSNIKIHLRRLLSIKFLPIVVFWIGYGLYVFAYLRPNAVAISGSYVLGLSVSSFKVFFSQSIMGLPLVSLRNGDLSFTPLSLIIALIFVFIANSSFKRLFLVMQQRVARDEIISKEVNRDKFYSYFLLLFSLTMILSPGLMMAMQPAWWNRADFLHSYLGVMITEFGTAILIAYLVNQVIVNNLNPVILKRKNK